MSNNSTTLSTRITISLGVKMLLIIVMIFSDNIIKYRFVLGGFTAVMEVLDFLLIIIPYYRFRRMEKKILQQDIWDISVDHGVSLTPDSDEITARFREQLESMRNSEIDMKHSSYIALQNQINPHFLYNTLDAIRSDAMKAGSYEIAELIEALSSFFAYTISNMDKYATVYEELEHVKEYYYIQKYRFQDRLNMIVDNSEGVDLKSLYMPRLVLQPLVENAISHGLEVKKKSGTVTISFCETEKEIEIHVRDDGAGMDEMALQKLNQRLEDPMQSSSDEVKRKGGIALGNVQRRIRILSGADYGLHVYSVLNVGTDLVVRLPKLHEVIKG